MNKVLRRDRRSIWLTTTLTLLLWLVAALPGHAQGVVEVCVYIVQSGDTLGRIAAANDTSVASLLELNPEIRNANLIYPGQVLLLPNCDEPGSAGSWADDAGDVAAWEREYERVEVPAKPADLPAALWRVVHDATFNVRYPVGSPYIGGSGVMIGVDGRTFVTAYHVIDNRDTDDPSDYAQTVEVGPFAQWRYTADTLAVDREDDLAVLQVNEPDFPGFAVAPVGRSWQLEFGDPIYTLSYPLQGTALITSKGSFLEKYYDPYYASPVIVTDAEATFGSSGGVALNRNGEVIGIISAGIIGREYAEAFGYSGTDSLTLIVPIEAAYPMLWELGIRTNRSGRVVR